jgi:hypothetical protein
MASADGELPPVAPPARARKAAHHKKVANRRKAGHHEARRGKAHGQTTRVAARKHAKPTSHGKKIAVASAHKRDSNAIGHIHSRDESHALRVASESGGKRPH